MVGNGSDDAGEANVAGAARRRTTGKRHSFRRRLAIRMTLLCVSILVLSLLTVFVTIQRSLWLNHDRMLASIARSEIASSMDGPSGQVHTHDASAIALNLKGGDGYEKFVQIMDRGGRIVAHTTNIVSPTDFRIDQGAAEIARAQGSSLGDVWHQEVRYRALYYRLRDVDGDEFLAVLALPREPVLRLLRLLGFALTVTLLVAGAASAVASFKLAEYLTRPLERIAAAASSVQEGDLTVRIPEVSDDAEFKDVTRGLNDMLERLEFAFGVQQRALESRQRFTADASHELRTPLSNLQGHLEVALRNPRTIEEYRLTLGIALSETKRMARLVADLLTLSRADTNLLRLRPSTCNLVTIASDCCRAFRERFHAAEVDLIVEDAGDLIVTADPDRLTQVVENLLDNALRHAPRGSVVRVVLSDNSGQASLSVVDSGRGLNAEEQLHVFERFYRTDPSRTTDEGGTGLGLSIAKAIMEAHEGTIEVTSEPGRTTAFTVRLNHELVAKPTAGSPQAV